MIKNVIVIGNSLLAVLLCRELEKKIGPRVDYTITYLTETPEIVSPRLVSLFGKTKKIDKVDLLKNSQLQVCQVKSINLREKRVIATTGTFEYDYLVLDQTPYFSADYLSSIREQLVNIFAAVSAQEKLGKQPVSKIAVDGGSAIFWQLALAVKRDVIAHRIRRLAIELINPDNNEVEGFLRQNGLDVRSQPSDLPGFQIHLPKSPVDLRKVKGLKLGEKHPLIDQYHQPLTSSKMLIVRSDDLKTINLISVTRAMAKRFAWNILADLGEESSPKREADLSKAIQLVGIRQSCLWIDKNSSRLIRTGMVRVWENFLWDNLKSRSKH